jgi:TRAP-type mannitol/chloroaromatic compound transport system substrate-binding protein|tara:strand:- start:10320 stop:11630 length:1311 start_codon:yes stop_codon:yes gene_type:complete
MSDEQEVDQEVNGIESLFDRRKFLAHSGIAVGGFAAGSAILAACGSDAAGPTTTAAPATTAAPTTTAGATTTTAAATTTTAAATTTTAAAAETTTTAVELSSDLPDIEWEMGTSWPTALVTLFGSAQIFCDAVSRLTGGKFTINPRPAGEIVAGGQVLPTVRDKGMEMGHTASYYYVGISPIQQFGTAVPFGLNQRQQNAWLYQGGGLEILQEFYAEEHNMIFFPAGATGCQMGGWFSKEINTVDDLQGLTMRIPGIGGAVLNNLGGEQISIPGGEILTAIETGAIDAAEFVGPTDDLILGLDELGTELFYYHPGWWEPGTALEVEIHLDNWNSLPEEYQAAIETASAYANMHCLATYDTLNQRDLAKIKEFATILEFSPELMSAFKQGTEDELDRIAGEDARFAAILAPWREYRDGIVEWHGLAEKSYLMQQTGI